MLDVEVVVVQCDIVALEQVIMTVLMLDFNF